MELINSVNIDALYALASKLIVLVGIMAFLVSVVTQVLKQILMDGLINKLATAEEEFDALPLEKAGRLLTSLSRTKVYKDRVKQDMQKKADLAFSEMEDRIMKLIRQDPEAAAQLRTILQEAKDRMMQDD